MPLMNAGAMDLTKMALGFGQAPNPYTFAGGGGQIGAAAAAAAFGQQGQGPEERGPPAADVQKTAVEVTIGALLRRGLLQPGADAHPVNADARAGAAQQLQTDQSNKALAFLHELLAGAGAAAGTAGPPAGAPGPPLGAIDSDAGRGCRRSEVASPFDKALRQAPLRR